MLWLLSNYLSLNIEALQNDEAFLKFCAENKDYRFERSATGKIIIMPPTGFETSERNNELAFQITLWNKKYKLGRVTDSNGGFRLPSSAIKAPDVAWVSNENYNKLSAKDKKTFAPICPNFVIELRSETDNMRELKAKMLEYIDNGCELAWLIDFDNETVHIYHQNGSVTAHTDFSKPLSGAPVLPGFELNLQGI